QTESEGVELSWRNYDSSELSRLNHDGEPYNQRLDLLLENLTRQTGLTFSKETATVEKWFVSENGAIKSSQPAVPDGAMLRPATAEAENKTQQEQLNKILEKFSNGKTDDKSGSDSKSVRESVEGYIAAALAGEDAKAAEYAYPDSAVAAQTGDMREVLQGQDIKTVGMYIGEWNSLAISSVIQADHGRTGSIVLHLKKMILDQKAHWLIDDIDIEEIDKIGEQIRYFINNVPDAKTIIISAHKFATEQAGGQFETNTKSIHTNQVVMKLVDPNSKPVAGARVGTYVDFSDIAENPPIWFLRSGRNSTSVNVKSDEHGKVTLEADEIFGSGWTIEGLAPLTAIDEGHYLAGLREMSRKDLGKEVTLMLQPGCRVHGRLTAATARKRKWSTKTLTVYVHWYAHRPCQYSSKQGRFEFILPPGKYQIQVYSDDPDKDVILPILIKPGQRDLDLTKYLDGTSKPPAVEIENLTESDSPGESRQGQTPAPGVPMLAKSTAPSGEDKSTVKVECLVGEAFPDPKMDRETIIAIENLLGGKITIPDSPTAADLLRKAAQATAMVKDKRVTQEQFNNLVDLLLSRGFVKILLRPTLEVVDGQTTTIRSSEENIKDLIQITPTIRENGSIILHANLELTLKSEEPDANQPSNIRRWKMTTSANIDPGQSWIVEGIKTAEQSSGAREQKSELLVILTPTIARSTKQKEPMETVNFQNAEARNIIEKLAAWTGKTIIPPANLMKQKITIYSSKPMPRSEAAAMILNALCSKGYAAEQTDDTIYLKPLPEEEQPNTGKAKIQIEARIMTVGDEFLKEIGFDPNSIPDFNAWPEPKPSSVWNSDNLKTYNIALNESNVDFLLKTALAHKDTKVLTAPRVTAWDRKTAEMAVSTEYNYTSGYSEPNRPGEEPKPKFDTATLGTFLKIRPQQTSDKKDVIFIDFELEIHRLQSVEDRMYKGKYPYQIPHISVVRTRTQCLIPDGLTLLNCGQKSPGRSKPPQLCRYWVDCRLSADFLIAHPKRRKQGIS
ncbi:MAG TPA: hypothetical protein DIU00_18350, partial [Phycisphaerales bacterium]|nr:hypothetical protein [Phycisphaerales bacterium]